MWGRLEKERRGEVLININCISIAGFRGQKDALVCSNTSVNVR